MSNHEKVNDEIEIRQFQWEPARFILMASTLLFAFLFQPLSVSTEVIDRSVRIAAWIVQIAPSFIFAITSGVVAVLLSLIFTKDKTKLFERRNAEPKPKTFHSF